jgi:hypothetical protein
MTALSEQRHENAHHAQGGDHRVARIRRGSGSRTARSEECAEASKPGICDPRDARMIVRTKGGASLHAWALGVSVKCTDKNQSVPPQTHEVPKDIAANVFTNVYSVEITEDANPSLPAQKVQRCG